MIAGFDERFYRVNPACTRVLGYSEPELLGMHYVDLVHEEDRAHGRQLLAQLAAGKAWDLPYLDVRMRTKSGGYRSIRWSAAPWKDEERIVAVGRDVTRLRETELSLHERDAMLARAEQMAGMGSWSWDAGNDRATVSDSLLEIMGQARNSGPQNMDQFLHIVAEESRDALRAAIDRVISGGEPATLPCRVRRDDGALREVQSFIEPERAPDGAIQGAAGAFLDVTEFKNAEARARESERQLRALAARLQKIREEERTRISREIHDELGQLLTALKMDLTLFGRDIAADASDSEGGRKAAEVASMVRLVDSTLQSVRRIARQLRPEVLDMLGLVPAIEWQAGELQTRTGLICRVHAPAGMPELDSERSTALFRIVQEALTNVARHAGATSVEISLEHAGEELRLSVQDDGKGFESGQADVPSLGVLGMRERSAGIGAILEIESRAESGTTITVRIPLPEPASALPEP